MPALPPLPHSRVAVLAVVFASVTALACSRDGSQPDDRQPSATPSEPATPAGQAESAPTPGTPPSPQAARMQDPMPDHCPMLVEGVVVEAADTVALQFTSASGDLDDLRARVGHMARMYSSHAEGGAMMWHPMGHARGMHDQPGVGGTMPTATAAIETIDGGARLVLTPEDPDQLDRLREQVREHQRRMTDHECPVPAA